MVIKNKIREIENLLKERAKKHSTIKYHEIYQIFENENNDEKISKNDIWNTFEQSCLNLAHSENAIYGALMSNQNNIPSDGFFDIYRNKRREKYKQIAGDKIIQDLTLEEMKKITEDERSTVYKHVQNI